MKSREPGVVTAASENHQATVRQSCRIAARGIRARGRHGATPGERVEAQEFVVDVEVVVRVAGDALDETVDYRVLVERARNGVAATSFELLESLAHGLARSLRELPGVLRAEVTVHKPAAAARLGIEDVSARVALD